MFLWAALFLAISIGAGAFGFDAVGVASSEVARVVFGVFAALGFVSILVGLLDRVDRRPHHKRKSDRQQLSTR